MLLLSVVMARIVLVDLFERDDTSDDAGNNNAVENAATALLLLRAITAFESLLEGTNRRRRPQKQKAKVMACGRDVSIFIS